MTNEGSEGSSPRGLDRLRPRTWFLISIACLIGGIVFWQLGKRYEEGRRQQQSAQSTNAALQPEIIQPEIIEAPGARKYRQSDPLLAGLTNQATNVQRSTFNVQRSTNLLSLRVTNSSKTLPQLMQSDTGLLLRNALIDTAAAAPAIPEHLRASEEPGSYIVQAVGAIDDAFRSYLKAAQAEIISYIPNNAYLVRMSADGAQKMQSYRGTRAVLPWEPYYKIDLRLLAGAVVNEPLPQGTRLNVLLFPGERESGLQAVEALGAKLVMEQRSPFGHQLTVSVPPDSLAALAQLPNVQAIEPFAERQLANDLGRPRITVSRNSITNVNYLNLTGAGVQVNVNDSGVDETHLDLSGRVFGLTTDLNGHGTHVAGTIAGNGSQSQNLNEPPPWTPPGSPTNRADLDFRGVAHEARIFAQSIDTLATPGLDDATLQENAARNTNFISNNSWNYLNSFDYNLASASYDAAVRDALPGETGSQPLLFVFAAGSAGGGFDDGTGGFSDGIGSPGNAKNVITVGAIESPRRITNEVRDAFGITNRQFLGSTDEQDQVAAFSSRGNVGIGFEGDTGRFKPDVVAPGTFIISCRSKDYEDPTFAGGTIVTRIEDQGLRRGETNYYGIFVPPNGTNLGIRIVRNINSRRGVPPIDIHSDMGDITDPPPPLTAGNFRNTGVNQAFFPVTEGFWWYALHNTNRQTAFFDILTFLFVTNDVGNYFEVLSNMNWKIGPHYRYESGSSMSAGFVSGTLALMQQFFTDPQFGFQWTNSPALMKALLINGARSMRDYDLHPNSAINYQGWGVVNLTNIIPPTLNGGPGRFADSPTIFYDQDPNYSLATGESHTRSIQLSQQARGLPLRVSLVWTDPPGNPAASLKLVNDLDLIVTNRANGEYYIGNNFRPGADFTHSIPANNTNTVPFDVVNNVENVYINGPLGTNYDIVVRARRVNVNAVTAQTNGVLQDYALVISVGNSALTNRAFTTLPATPVPTANQMTWYLKELTNQQALVNERVGANFTVRDPAPYDGYTNQWNFYVFRNTNTTVNTNVAIITFLPPNISQTRVLEADIDLYVSTDPSLTNLNPVVLANAANNVPGSRSWSSRTRLGTELVGIIGTGEPIYYIGVKSEDQQAADFGIFALATDQSLGGEDDEGNLRLNFFSTSGTGVVPDGSAEDPGGLFFLAPVIPTSGQEIVRRVVLTNIITHENGGDLLGLLFKGTRFAALNNHRQFPGLTDISIYDDSTEDDIPGSRPTDGPGSLNDFAGESAVGVWMYTIADNAPFQTGQVDFIRGVIEPEEDLLNGNGLFVSRLDPGKWRFFSVDVEPAVTNMTINVYNINPPEALDVYLRYGARPNVNVYDKFGQVPGTGGSLTCSIFDDPPLQTGRYVIGVSNPSMATVSFNIRVDFQYSLTPINAETYSQNPGMLLLDNAVTNSTILVTNEGTIADVKVGIRLDHPRLSDLVLHLVSPQGTRILLAENRGGLTDATGASVTNWGIGSPQTFVFPISSTGGPAENSLIITGAPPQGVLNITYQFFQVPDRLRVYYPPRTDPSSTRIFDSGLISGSGTFTIGYGPGGTDIEIVMNEGNSSLSTLWNYVATITGPWNYVTFTDNTNLGTLYKFEPPPYFTALTNTVILSNSFEGAGPIVDTNMTNYGYGDVFENWRVVTNGVAVISDTNGLPLHGTNYLALSHGQVSLPITNITRDKEYELRFAYRKISSAPTQAVSLAKQPNQAQVPGVNALADIFRFVSPTNRNSGIPVAVPKLRVCPAQEVFFTVGTNRITTADGTYGPEGDTNRPNNIGPLYGLIGCWSSRPDRLDSNCVASQPFYIGTNYFMGDTNVNVLKAPAEPGDYYLFLGVNDEDFMGNDANTFFSVTVFWQQCQWTSAEYLLGNTPKLLVGDFDWRTEKIRFTANRSVTNLLLRTNINTTMLFDNFQLEEAVQTVYYLSEEPLSSLQGEFAPGEWTLEIWDTRAGPLTGTNESGILHSWSLNMIFGDIAPAIPLTNGVDYVGVVRGDQTRYFSVAVPIEVNGAVNLVTSLNGNELDMFYNPFGLPRGGIPPDALAVSDGVPLVIDRANPFGAPMPLGRRYFLAVRNVDPSQVTPFTIRAEFDIPITPLQNGVASFPPLTIPGNPYPFSAFKDDSELAVNNMQYWYFDVTTNGLSAKFEVASSSPGGRNINLVLKRALPVVDLFPTPTRFEYQATEIAPGPRDLILINSNSMPVRLAPGRWYLGVYNFETNDVTYQVRATESNQLLYSYIDLTNAVPTNFTVFGRNEQLLNFYRFVADQTNAAILFEIYDVDSDVDMIVKRSDLPSRELYDFSFLSAGNQFNFFNSGYEPVPLRTNLFIPHLNATNWWIGLYTRQFDPASGMICVKTFTNINPIIGCVFGARATNIAGALNICWTTTPGSPYTLELTTNLVDWSPIFQTTAAPTADTCFADTNAASGLRLYRIRSP